MSTSTRKPTLFTVLVIWLAILTCYMVLFNAGWELYKSL